MQIRVHPRARRILDPLGDFVRAVPVAFRVVPQGDERSRGPGRGVGVERCAELVECHTPILPRRLGFPRMVYVPRALVVILLVASLAGPSSAAPQAVQDQAPQAAQPSHTDKARALVGLLTSGDFAAAVATFDATMTAALPEEKLREFWTVVAGQAGAFQQIESAREEPRGAYTAVILRAAFAHIDADLTVVYDTAGAVAGFNIRPATPPPLSSPPYADQSAFTEQDVTVGSGEWALPD